MADILLGFSNVLQPMNIVICLGGLFIGVLFGALPGFSATMAVAIFVPFTYVMEPGAATRGVSVQPMCGYDRVAVGGWLVGVGASVG